MRRLWFRLLCALGLHDWRYSTITDIAPDRFEVQDCARARCPQMRGREWKPGVFGDTPGTNYVTGHGYIHGSARGRWGRWEQYEPDPEPPLGAWY